MPKGSFLKQNRPNGVVKVGVGAIPWREVSARSLNLRRAY